MLRIAKTTPGVLDLSAVKDEHGIPVTLVGPSHRDVPDHEEHNPVLRRIVELRWVTVSKVPVGPPDGTASEISSDPAPASDSPPVPDLSPQLDPVIAAEPGPPEVAAESAPANDNPIPPTTAADPTTADGSPDTQDDQAPATSVADVAPSPATKPERRSSRRS